MFFFISLTTLGGILVFNVSLEQTRNSTTQLFLLTGLYIFMSVVVASTAFFVCCWCVKRVACSAPHQKSTSCTSVGVPDCDLDTRLLVVLPVGLVSGDGWCCVVVVWLVLDDVLAAGLAE